MFLTKWFQHLSFHAHAEDLGRFHSVLWNTVHGKFAVDSLTGEIYFSDHLMFFLLLLVPFYWIHAGPETLFALTALWFAAAAVCFWRLALERLSDRFLALLLCLAFASNRYVWGAFLHEFHPDFFAPVLFFLLFVAYERRRKFLYFTTLTLLLILKEDYSLYLIPIGLYFLIRKNARFLGLATVAFASLYAFTAFSFVLPFFYAAEGKAGGYSYLASWPHAGGSFAGIAASVFTHPSGWLNAVSTRALTNFGLKFLLLPLASPLTLVHLVPTLLVHLSSAHPLIRGLSIHYGLVPATLAFLASVEGLRNLRKYAGRFANAVSAAVAAVLIAVGLFRFTFFIPVKETREDFLPWLVSVGESAVCIQSSLFPHVAPIDRLSIFPDCAPKTELLSIHISADTYPFSQTQFRKEIRDLLVTYRLKFFGREGDWVLFRRAAK